MNRKNGCQIQVQQSKRFHNSQLLNSGGVFAGQCFPWPLVQLGAKTAAAVQEIRAIDMTKHNAIFMKIKIISFSHLLRGNFLFTFHPHFEYSSSLFFCRVNV